MQNGKCGTIRVTTDPTEAVKDADVINTDVWASMGQESESEARKKIFMPYKEEITDEVMEGKQSVVWDQAKNKMHIHKAVLETLILRLG